MPKIFLKWYKNGGRGNGFAGFDCARKKVCWVALLHTTQTLLFLKFYEKHDLQKFLN